MADHDDRLRELVACGADGVLPPQALEDIAQVLRERDEARAQAHDATVLLIHRTRERDAEAENARLMQDRLTRLVEGANRLRALLRKVEEYHDECQFCGAWKTDHVPDCRLKAALEGRDEHRARPSDE